jgi:hypothetical protein
VNDKIRSHSLTYLQSEKSHCGAVENEIMSNPTGDVVVVVVEIKTFIGRKLTSQLHLCKNTIANVYYVQHTTQKQ